MGNSSGNNSASKAPPIIQRKYSNKKNELKYVEHRIVQNFILIWLDGNIDQSTKDCQYTISQLRQFVNSISTFNKPDECQHFIENNEKEHIFLIVSGSFGRTFIPLVHELVQLDYIYVFCGTPSAHKDWTERWKKIKLVSDQIEHICTSLGKDAAQCEHDLIPTSIVSFSDSVSQDLKEIDPSFMYSQLLKEILLELTYNEEALSILVEFCRKHYCGNGKELKIIEEFARDYSKHTPIWWYTRECFTYHMLNRSLRTVDIEVIAMMGFFMKDIHKQIEMLHTNRSDRSTSFTVYRGQGMLNSDFERIEKNVGGLLAFNSFLSTSVERNVAMTFANKTAPNKVNVIFVMSIDPTITSIPFAGVNDLGFYKAEWEILFSMHTIFRIVKVTRKEGHACEIELKSMKDNDSQMTRLIKQMRLELGGGTAIDRLGQLMINLGELKKADDLYQFLLESTPINDEKALARLNGQCGYIKSKLGDCSTAKSLYQKAMEVQEKLPMCSTTMKLRRSYAVAAITL